MLSLGLTGTIHLAVEPVDGRKGIDGLAGVVRASLGRDPTSGDLFVFRNRRGGSLKILAGMGDGFALYLRRLEQEPSPSHRPTPANSRSRRPSWP